MTKQQPPLKRTLTYPLLTLYGLGTILGAGIYVLIGKVAATSGLYAPLAFIVAAILAGLSGYSYAALSSRYPKSAGESVYIQAAFSKQFLSTLVGWMVILTGVVSAATIANGFVGYLNTFIPVSEFLAITLMLIGLCLLACWGVAESVKVAATITVIEVAGLLFVLAIAGDSLALLPQRLPELIPNINDGDAWFAILLGAFLAFYAFIGFEDMVNMAEEVKQPERTLPKAIFSALIISSLLYAVIALVAILSLPLETLQQSQAPMADILLQHSTRASTIISLISLVAVMNGALVQIIMGARVMYGLGKLGLAPQWLGRVNARFQTPIVATMLISLVVWILAVAFPLETLAKLTSFIIIIVFLLVNISLIVILKREIKTENGVMQVNPYIPYIATILCTLFLGTQIYSLYNGIALGH
jgi:APA family basic amino acid/polyamine antiporter